MKPSFVLIRGLVREKGHWGEFLDLLKARYPDSPIVCLDIPGAGDHYQVKAPLDLTKMVEFMRQDLRTHQISGPVVLVAISLGGMIASSWFKQFPQDFQYAVLINTSFGNVAPVWQRLKPKALQKLSKVPFTKGAQRERRILEVVSNVPELYEERAQKWGEIAQLRPVSLENTIRQLLAAALYRSPVKKPPIPVLLMGSSQDRMVDVACTRKIAKLWKAPALEHPSAGHDLTNDDPSWVVEKLQYWLDDVNG